jgi:hypothetical protein
MMPAPTGTGKDGSRPHQALGRVFCKEKLGYEYD